MVAASCASRAALADNPDRRRIRFVSMITKGGLNAVIRKPGHGIRERAYSIQRRSSRGRRLRPLHADDSKDSLKSLAPMGTVSTVEDIASAVVYLTEARQITGEVLHVDGGAHIGKW